MNRIDRLTAILIQLQSRKVVKAQDIADRFRISLRTVYRDIHALSEGGVPVIGEAGVGYSIMEGYRLPPVMFTAAEAGAFLTAEKLVERYTDRHTESSYKSAMYKIRAVLRSGEKDYIEKIEANITALADPYLPEAKNDQLPEILRSISDKHLLQILYSTVYTEEETERKIEPVGIFHSSHHWHLIAWCHLRKDYRQFRVDRILRLRHTTEAFKKNHPTLEEYLNRVTKEKEMHKIVMQADKHIVKLLGNQKYYNGYVSEIKLENKVEMTFLTSSIEGFARWYIMFADHADIISPPVLKTRIKEILEQMSRRMIAGS